MRGLGFLFLSLVLNSIWTLPASSTTLPGAPQPPRPGSVPRAWLAILNDTLGGEIGDNPDDFRTQAFSGAVRRGKDQRWVAAFDYSILTNKGSVRFAKGRVDELTATFGRYLIDPATHENGWLAAGLGGRYTGDLAGEGLQNGWHELLDIDPIDLPYEKTDELNGLVYVYGSLQTERDFLSFPHFAPFISRSRLVPGVEGGFLLTAAGELQGQLTAQLAWLGADASLWIGARQEIRAGDTPNGTTRAVAEREEGAWLIYGGRFGGFFFEGGWHLENDASMGRAGWVWRGPLAESDGDAGDFFGEVGTTLNSYGWGIQLRWASPLLDLRSLGDRTSFLIDYRYGGVPNVELQDQELQYQQATVGLDLEILRRKSGFSPVPFVALTAGWRREEIQDDGDFPLFREESASTGVAQLSAGVRLYLPERSGGRPRYGLVVVASGWLPFSDAEAARGPLRLRYLQPETTVGLRLTVQPRW